MAPPRKDAQLMYLNVDRLEMELTKRLRKANEEIKNLLKDTVIRNASTLPMKSNAVMMKDGVTTSDAARRGALVKSIKADRIGTFEGTKTWGSIALGSYVEAMASNFKDSHVGWYYEVGTGEESDEELYNKYGLTASLGEENPYRLKHVGAPIVSRSKSVNGGEWTDLGGNLRTTNSYVGGIGGDTIPVHEKGSNKGKPITTPERYEKIKAKFRQNIGEDIYAYEWYRNAVDEVRDEVLSIYTNSIRDLNILDPKYGIFYLNPNYEIR